MQRVHKAAGEAADVSLKEQAHAALAEAAAAGEALDAARAEVELLRARLDDATARGAVGEAVVEGQSEARATLEAELGRLQVRWEGAASSLPSTYPHPLVPPRPRKAALSAARRTAASATARAEAERVRAEETLAAVRGRATALEAELASRPSCTEHARLLRERRVLRRALQHVWSAVPAEGVGESAVAGIVAVSGREGFDPGAGDDGGDDRGAGAEEDESHADWLAARLTGLQRELVASRVRGCGCAAGGRASDGRA